VSPPRSKSSHSRSASSKPPAGPLPPLMGRAAFLIVPNEVLDGGLIGALGERRTALFVYVLLRWHGYVRDDRFRERGGLLVSTVSVNEIAQRLGLDRRSVARNLRLLEAWGWITTSGRLKVIGTRNEKEGERFFFDGWIRKHLGRAKPTESRKTMAARVTRVRSLLDEMERRPPAEPIAGGVVRDRFVRLDANDVLLTSEETRGAALICMCLARVRYLKSGVSDTHGRRARSGQAYLGAMCDVGRDTVGRWLRIAEEAQRVRQHPQGVRKRTQIELPRESLSPEEALAEIVAITSTSGSSDSINVRT
jgi:hypothetical protein